jgi:predicted metal-dependent phosphoesterase TrpH
MKKLVEKIKVELHLHTYASKDSLIQPQKLLEKCDRLEIDRFAVTDHNVMEGAIELKNVAPERVIVGEEIQTTQGELIGYFMCEWVPPGLTPMETIERLRSQGAVISIPHPFDAIRSQGWTQAQLERIVPHVDAIETFNARCLRNQPNEKAKEFAYRWNKLETVGSDAHSLWEVGRAHLIMEGFSDAKSFLLALKQAKQVMDKSPAWVHLFSRYAALHKKVSAK